MFNCEIATNKFPEKFVNAIKVISDYPILKIRNRERGITSGKAGNCYWNSSIISQTFGGETIFGYCISNVGDGNYKLYGHGCWLNPEGSLIDVTKVEKDYRYFLPVDQKLVLNGKVSEVLRDLYFVKTQDALDAAFMDMADSHHETFISTHKCKENDSKYLHVKKDRSEYFNKLFLCDALPLSIIEHYFPLPKWKEKIEQVWYHCRPFIEEVTKDSFIKYKCRQTEPFLDQLKRFNSRTTIGNKDSWLEMAYEEGGYDFCFGMWKGIDCTWSDPRITNTSIVGISTSSGKKIDDYQFHEDVIKQHPIPKDKKTKNLLKTQVKQLNHFGLDHFSYRDCLILSNPFLYPHPRLVKKLGIKNPIIDSPIKRVALAKEAI